jgi:putative aldouronate transport system permease protein
MIKNNRRPLIKRTEIPLHLMLIPGLIITFVFAYIPLAGLTVAFQRFIPAKGLFGDQTWVGLGNLELIFSMPSTMNVIRNTVVISFGKIVLGLVVPIIVTLLLNEVSSSKIKRSIQTIIYFPYFLSWVVFAALLIEMLSPSTGMVNKLLGSLGIEPIFFLGDNRYFQGTMIVTDTIKNFGYGTVVYMAAITGIDPTLYEAAAIDGAGRWRQTLHITLPGLSMVIVLMMVLSLGGVLNAGFDQIFNLYNPYVYETGDVIDTMMYRLGLVQAMFGPSTAMGLLKSLVSFVFISISYLAAWKFSDYRIF